MKRFLCLFFALATAASADWTVTINDDTDDPNIGTITAVESDGFAMSARVKRTPEGIDDFVKKALSAHVAYQEKVASKISVAQSIADKLNGQK